MSKRSTAALSPKSTPKGTLVILSSPSGGGKTSICRKLLSPARKRAGWQFSISYTTRQMRTGEKNGREYHFVNEQTFDSLVDQDAFAEEFKVHLYKYGTPRGPIEKVRKKGGVMLLDVDVQGAQRLRKEYPDSIAIFILPPSIDALRKRLRRRGTETELQLKVRFENAIKEMRSFREYGFDYVVVNDQLDRAVRQVLAIIECHPCRVELIDEEQLKKLTGYTGTSRT